AISAQMSESRQIVAHVLLKDDARIAAIQFGRRVQEHTAEGWQQSADRESRVANAVLAAEQGFVNEWPVHPRQHVAMLRVHFSEGSPHPSRAQQQTGREGGKRHVSF